MTGGSPIRTSIFGQSQDGTSDGTGPRDPNQVSHSQGGESAVGNASFSTDASMGDHGQPISSDPVGKWTYIWVYMYVYILWNHLSYTSMSQVPLTFNSFSLLASIAGRLAVLSGGRDRALSLGRSYGWNRKQQQGLCIGLIRLAGFSFPVRCDWGSH